MTFSERVLLSLSRAPESTDYISKGDNSSGGDALALALLHEAFPNFGQMVTGKRILDFGCGMGFQALALARQCGCSVVGVEANEATFLRAVAMSEAERMPKSFLFFVRELHKEMMGEFDIVISQNSFEHFEDPCGILTQMKNLIKVSGKILITFGPPWFAPYGSHMHYFCRVPWINLLFSDETVHRVRSYYRNDQSKPYEGLNRMTIAKFESIIRDCGMLQEMVHYTCVKRMNFFSKIPLLRELFINQVNAVLIKQ